MAGKEVRVPIITVLDDKGLKNAENALSSLTGKIQTFARVAAASYVVSKATDFVQSSVDAAMQLQRNMQGVKTIFGDSTKNVLNFISASEQLGMSHAQAAKSVAFLGSVFKQTGMPMQDVIGHTQQMVSLGADLAATYGFSVEEALTAMTATFRGEYDPIEKFGVAMKQQQVNAELAARGLKGLTGSKLIAAQQEVRFQMLLQRTADAQGAFARSSGNLFQQQEILKAKFEDIQATLGGRLLPVMVKAVQTISPLLDELMPKIVKVFDSIGTVMGVIIPYIPKFAQTVADMMGMLGDFTVSINGWFKGLVGGLLSAIPGILAFILAFKGVRAIIGLIPILEGLIVQFVGLKAGLMAATLAEESFAAASAATPWGAIAAGVALIASAWAMNVQWLNQYNQAQQGIKGLSPELQKQANAFADKKAAAIGQSGFGGMNESIRANALQEWWAKYQAKHAKIDNNNIMQDWKTLQAQIAGLFGNDGSNTVLNQKTKSWFESFAEEVKKQTKRLKLKSLNLNDALIESLLSASDWNAAVTKVLGMTKSQLTKFVTDWKNTAAGQAALDKDLADRTAKFVDAVKTRIDTIKTLAGDMSAFIPKSYSDSTKQLGQFESSVVSASDALRNNLKAALDNKGITQSAYDNLLAYANREVAVLQKIAAQRDVLVAKIEAAKSVYLEVANAVRGYGNITSTSTQQITESYVKWIDGVEVTVSRTVEALQNSDLVATYKSIVDKTKTFVKNLADLKKMGLNSTLFKQIVDAGVDAGGATAAAIVAGGQDTVVSLNDLFGQLDVAGQQMADMTAQVMSDNGVTVVSGFIDGLMSQESALATAAQSMAKTFSDAWANNVKFSIPMVNAADFGLTKAQADKALTDAGLPTDQGGTGENDFDKKIVPPPVVPPVIPPPEVIPPIVPPTVTAPYNPMTDWYKTGGYQNVNTSGIPSPTGQYNPMTDWAAYGGYQSAPTYNVTVNAGIGTDGAAVGQTVVQLLKQYERNNGSVWVSAV